MKKHISALIAAVLITAVIGFGIFVIGVNALANRNTVPLQNTPGAATTSSSTTSNTTNVSAPAAGSVQQLQQEITTLQSQLSQASQTLQQYQSLIQVLQQRGVIVIDQNGNIFIPGGER